MTKEGGRWETSGGRNETKGAGASSEGENGFGEEKRRENRGINKR